MTKHIMVDLETWGTEPGCDIRSIGACVFDPMRNEFVRDEHGVTHTFYIAVDNPITHIGSGRMNTGVEYRKYPLDRDPRTVQWWSEQSDEAQAAFANPVDLKDGLKQLTIWISSICSPGVVPPSGGHKNVRIWYHGPHFDHSILAAAFRAVGLPLPVHYRAPRDTRTAFDLAGIDDHTAWLGQHPGPLGIPHHALDDSICQAKAVCAAYEIIGAWRETYEEHC